MKKNKTQIVYLLISLIKCIELTWLKKLTNLKSTNGGAYKISFISDPFLLPEPGDMVWITIGFLVSNLDS